MSEQKDALCRKDHIRSALKVGLPHNLKQVLKRGDFRDHQQFKLTSPGRVPDCAAHARRGVLAGQKLLLNRGTQGRIASIAQFLRQSCCRSLMHVQPLGQPGTGQERHFAALFGQCLDDLLFGPGEAGALAAHTVKKTGHPQNALRTQCCLQGLFLSMAVFNGWQDDAMAH